MPTFHHWRAGTQRNGLTFQTAADARAFDKGVVRAYNELIDGMHTNLNIYTHSTNLYPLFGPYPALSSSHLAVHAAFTSIHTLHAFYPLLLLFLLLLHTLEIVCLYFFL